MICLIAGKIKEAQDLEAKLKERNITPDRLFIHSFSDREIAHNVAALQPMTPAIRRELYQKVNRKKLYLKYSFDDISLSEAMAVIDYADGKTEVMPSCLLTPEEARNIALQKQYDALSNIQLSNDKDPAKPEASSVKDTATSDLSTPNPALDRKFDLLTYRYSEEEGTTLLLP